MENLANLSMEEKWKQHIGSNSTTYNDNALNNNDVGMVVMTSNSPCANPTTATSNKTYITVSGSVVPSVIVIASQSKYLCRNKCNVYRYPNKWRNIASVPMEEKWKQR